MQITLSRSDRGPSGKGGRVDLRSQRKRRVSGGSWVLGPKNEGIPIPGCKSMETTLGKWENERISERRGGEYRSRGKKRRRKSETYERKT